MPDSRVFLPGQPVSVSSGPDAVPPYFEVVHGRFIQFAEFLGTSTMIVRLDVPLTVDYRDSELTGELLLLNPRYHGAVWEDQMTVNVYLCPTDAVHDGKLHQYDAEHLDSHGFLRTV